MPFIIFQDGIKVFGRTHGLHGRLIQVRREKSLDSTDLCAEPTNRGWRRG